MTYWDTSALIKLYVPEEGSSQLRQTAADFGEPLWTSAVAKVEYLCALFRIESEGRLEPGGLKVYQDRFTADEDAKIVRFAPLGKSVLKEVTDLLIKTQLQTPALALRSLDTIHVATALNLRAQTIISTDARMRRVAEKVGLRVLP